MTKKYGFTIIELLITISMMTILVGSIFFVYLTCFKAFNASEDRSKARTQLSQAVDLITKNLYNAQYITTCNATTLTFYANLGNAGDPTTYSYILSGNTLERTSGGAASGPMIATTIQPQGTVMKWGLTPALFSCSNGLVTIDMTAVGDAKTIAGIVTGETVHIRSNVQSRDMPVGLVGWWTMDDNASNKNVADYSGNGYNGTATANTSTLTTTGKINEALSFNGSSQNVSASNVLQPTTAITVSAWVKASSVSGVQPIAGTWDDVHGSYRTYVLCFQSTKAAFYISNNGTNFPDALGSTTLSSGNWYHLAGTYDGEYIRIYVNGQLDGVTTSSGSIATNSYPFYIGGMNAGGSMAYFPGVIDDVRIYNRVLSPNEVAQIYNEE